LEQKLYDNYVAILNSELMPAFGCTEPIAIAYASAKAASLLERRPDFIEIYCSGNIVKNVQGVTVPNSGGLKGIEVAAILGVLGGDASKKLEVLENITPDIIAETSSLVGTGYCKSRLAEGVANLYILSKVFAGEHCAEVEIRNKHTNIIRMSIDGKDIYHIDSESDDSHKSGDKKLLNVRDILDFADIVDIDDIKDVLDNQIQMNSVISDEGLKRNYGACVGRTLLQVYGDKDVKIRAKARAAAGSDARMSGCSLPVVINSGSGNQGMTVSLPVIEYAKEIGVTKEKLYRALVVSNLIALHQKKYIGNLSAYCGAVSAACGSGAAITYLYGGNYEEVSRTIINTIANVGGIVCDGAKASCAAKIASSVDAAIMGHYMSVNNHVFKNGEGLVQKDVEHTIRNLGYMGREGMKSTDIEILNMMMSEDSEAKKEDFPPEHTNPMC